MPATTEIPGLPLTMERVESIFESELMVGARQFFQKLLEATNGLRTEGDFWITREEADGVLIAMCERPSEVAPSSGNIERSDSVLRRQLSRAVGIALSGDVRSFRSHLTDTTGLVILTAEGNGGCHVSVCQEVRPEVATGTDSTAPASPPA